MRTQPFLKAFAKLMELEGGLVLHRVAGDAGGLTFGGISRNAWPDWEGWDILKEHGSHDLRLPGMVQKFYGVHYWDKLMCGEMPDGIATEIFTFGVVAGVGTSTKLAQGICEAKVDGIMGPATIDKINEMEATAPGLFVPWFKLGQIARYAAIARNDMTQRKFLLGWVNRALK